MAANSDSETDAEQGRTGIDGSVSDINNINDACPHHRSGSLILGHTKAHVVQSGDGSSVEFHIDHIFTISKDTNAAGQHKLYELNPGLTGYGPPEMHPLVTFSCTTQNGHKLYTVDDGKGGFANASAMLKDAFGDLASHFKWTAVTVDTSKVTENEDHPLNELHPGSLIFECDFAKVGAAKAAMERPTLTVKNSEPNDHVAGSA